MEGYKKIKQKRSIETYASKAQKAMLKNKQRISNNSNTRDEIQYYKELLLSLQIADKSELSNKLLMTIKNHNEKLNQLNESMDNQITLLNKKIENTKNNLKIIDDYTNVLTKEKENSFILYNTIKQKENEIVLIRSDIESTKIEVNEQRVDRFISDITIANRWFDDFLYECQKYFLTKLKDFNRLMNRIHKRKKGKVALKKEITRLRSQNSKFFQSSPHLFNKKKNNLTFKNEQFQNERDDLNPEQNENVKVKSKISNKDLTPLCTKSLINNFEKKEDLLNLSSSLNDEIIVEECQSDEDVDFNDKIKPKKTICQDYNDIIHTKVPKINLKQIEYNKEKFRQKEIDLYSIQRRNKFENVDNLIKERTDDIKKLKLKIRKNQLKVDKFSQFIAKYKKYFQNLKTFTNNNSFDINNNFILLIKDEPTANFDMITTKTEFVKDNKIRIQNKYNKHLNLDQIDVINEYDDDDNFNNDLKSA